VCTRTGISLKTQFLYALVFLTRYLDLFWNFASMYNWVMKIIFIASSCAIVYMMAAKAPYKDTYQKDKDTFKLWYLIVPCAVLALIFNESVELGREDRAGRQEQRDGTFAKNASALC
jgi:ER lumen protein retaining receptor